MHPLLWLLLLGGGFYLYNKNVVMAPGPLPLKATTDPLGFTEKFDVGFNDFARVMIEEVGTPVTTNFNGVRIVSQLLKIYPSGSSRGTLSDSYAQTVNAPAVAFVVVPNEYSNMGANGVDATIISAYGGDNTDQSVLDGIVAYTYRKLRESNAALRVINFA